MNISKEEQRLVDEKALKAEGEKRKNDFFKRASVGFLLKLFRLHSKDAYVWSEYSLQMIYAPKNELRLYDAHWTNSLLKKGEKITPYNRMYIETTIGELKGELDSRPHVETKKKRRAIRQKLAKKGK